MSMTAEEMAKRFRRALVPYRENSIAKRSERADIPAANSEAEMALTNAERQARWREKQKEINANNVTVTAHNGAVTAPETAPVEFLKPQVEVLPPPSSWNYPLAFCGLVLFAISVALMVLSAWGPNWASVAAWVALGIAAEGIQLFAWPWLPMISWPKRVAAVVLIAACFVFAVWNTFNIASIMAADQAQARVDASVAKLNEACPPATTTVEKKGKATKTVTVAPGAGCEVAKAALPQSAPQGRDFAALVSWVTAGAVRPNDADFSMLGLLLRTLLPQLGGVALFVARR